MDIKELCESVSTLINYNGHSSLSERESRIIYEYKKRLIGDDVEPLDEFTELYTNHRH